MKRSVLGVSFTICFVLVCFLTLISQSLFFKKLEYIALDYFFSARVPLKTSEQIVIIAIDEASLKRFGQWPWSREIMAYFLSALKKYSPNLVLLDAFFCDEFPLIDYFFVNAMTSSKNVSIPVVFSQPPYLKQRVQAAVPEGKSPDSKSPPNQESEDKGENVNENFLFKKLNLLNSNFSLSNYVADDMIHYNEGIYNSAFETGHGHAVPDSDGIVRHVPLFIRYKSTMLPQFALSALGKYFDLKFENSKKVKSNFGDTICIPHRLDAKKNISIPVDEDGMVLVNWADSWVKSFKKISFVDVMDAHESIKNGQPPRIPLKEILQGKICLVGLTAIGLIDIKPIPIDKNYPMLGVHANIINSILENNFIHEVSDLIKKLCIFLFSLSLFLFSGNIKRETQFCIFFLLMMLWFFCAYILFAHFNVFIPVITPIIGIILCFIINLAVHQIHSIREAKKLMHQVITDELTNLNTHRYFKYTLQNVLTPGVGGGHAPFSLILFDIDNFKRINDNFGHESGNIVLKELGKILIDTGKLPNIVNCRYGGEEFCVLILNASKSEGLAYADKIMEKIRAKVMNLDQKQISITVSLGVVASTEVLCKSPEDFLKAADSAMYHAKNSGKNRVVYFSPEYFMYDKFSSPKAHFNQTIDKESVKDPTSIEYISIDLKKRNEELESIIQKMQKMQKVILSHEKEAATRTLTAYVSHELNKPLHNIRSSLKVLERSMQNQKEKDFLNLIYEEIERINDLSRQIFNFHRPSEQIQKMHDVNELLEGLLKLSQEQFIAKGVFLNTAFDKAIPKTFCSGEELKQVFLNMIVNALDALSAGGKMEVNTVFEKGKIVILFKDNGKGIPQEILGQIFEPFFSTKIDSGGTGLGLSVSKSIIQKHNGTISVESKVDQGTIFRISLPIINAMMG